MSYLFYLLIKQRNKGKGATHPQFHLIPKLLYTGLQECNTTTHSSHLPHAPMYYSDYCFNKPARKQADPLKNTSD